MDCGVLRHRPPAAHALSLTLTTRIIRRIILHLQLATGAKRRRRFGFDSGEDRGFAGQYLREENYDRSHGLGRKPSVNSRPVRARRHISEIRRTAIR